MIVMNDNWPNETVVSVYWDVGGGGLPQWDCTGWGGNWPYACNGGLKAPGYVPGYANGYGVV